MSCKVDLLCDRQRATLGKAAPRLDSDSDSDRSSSGAFDRDDRTIAAASSQRELEYSPSSSAFRCIFLKHGLCTAPGGAVRFV